MLDHLLLFLLVVGVALSRSVAWAASYDYIVVGAGPTGIVVADRLSEKGKKVLLLERGGPSTAETGGSDVPPWANETHLTRFDIPGVSESVYFGNNQHWWCNDIVPRAACLVGGGSAINGILYWYPTDSEYSRSNGWPRGWQSVSKYLNKVKTRLPSTDNPSKDGKRYLTQVYHIVKSILKKQGYSGLAANDNRNKKNRVYSHTAYHIQNAKRTGPMDTYLKTARARPNFTFLTGTKVLSILRNGDQITAVQTNKPSAGDNGVFRVARKGRVVLAAGAFGTARLLFQSGIGPSDMLSIVAANSSTSQYMPPSSQYIDLPVGMNVQDNPAVRAVFTHPHIDSYNNWADVYLNPRPADAAQYISNRSGVLAAPSARVNFWKVYVGPDGKKRNTQTTCRPSAASPYNVSNAFTCTMYVSKGLTSVGRIGIDSGMRGVLLKNPWLVDPADRITLENAFSDFLSTYKQVNGLQLIAPNSTTSVSTHVATTFTGSNHWVGSTRIGMNRSTSVVDKDTKVWNTKNLFIVDAGIFPGMTVGNPVGSLMVMAEMASDKISAVPGGP